VHLASRLHGQNLTLNTVSYAYPAACAVQTKYAYVLSNVHRATTWIKGLAVAAVLQLCRMQLT
jgi:hypothetical protein